MVGRARSPSVRPSKVDPRKESRAARTGRGRRGRLQRRSEAPDHRGRDRGARRRRGRLWLPPLMKEDMMQTNGKVVINLSTGLEDPERVTVAFLVGGAAAAAGKPVTMFLTKEAVRL